MSTKIAAFIGGHEGFVSKWYLDPVSIPTIGFGFTWNSKVFREWWTARYGRKMKRGDTISKADALAVLTKLMDEEYGPPVDRMFAKRAGHVRDAGKSMVYNCGAGALKWQWAKKIAAGDIKGGCARWRSTATTARGKKLPGLVRRRGEEADIAEFNRYPSWVAGTADASKKVSVPDRHVGSDDIRQAQTWLKSLGYYHAEPDGIVGGKTRLAVKQFQQKHGNLVVDGIIGPATLSALQRATELKSKAAKVTVGGGATAGAGAGAGAAPSTTPVAADVPDWALDVVMWGGLAIVAVGLAYLAWRYRDEIATVMRKL